MHTYSRRAMLGTGAAAIGGLFVERVASAQQPSDFVLDHAGREMVRLHSRGPAARASTLALAAANLRLLADHPHVTGLHRHAVDAPADEGFVALRRELRTRHGYTGTVQDLRNLVIGSAPALGPSIFAEVKGGQAPAILSKIADRLDALSLRFDTSGFNSPARYPVPFGHPHLVPAFDPGEGVEPCVTLAVIQFGLTFVAIVAGMSGAGVIVGGILAGMGLILQIIRYGAC